MKMEGMEKEKEKENEERERMRTTRMERVVEKGIRVKRNMGLSTKKRLSISIALIYYENNLYDSVEDPFSLLSEDPDGSETGIDSWLFPGSLTGELF